VRQRLKQRLVQKFVPQAAAINEVFVINKEPFAPIRRHFKASTMNRQAQEKEYGMPNREDQRPKRGSTFAERYSWRRLPFGVASATWLRNLVFVSDINPSP
jgi:hypothetical protein